MLSDHTGYEITNRYRVGNRICMLQHFCPALRLAQAKETAQDGTGQAAGSPLLSQRIRLPFEL